MTYEGKTPSEIEAAQEAHLNRKHKLQKPWCAGPPYCPGCQDESEGRFYV